MQSVEYSTIISILKTMNKKIWAIVLAVAGVIAAAGLVFALVSKKRR